jgi:hypothetical protein
MGWLRAGRNRKIVYGITSRGRKALEVLGAAEHLEKACKPQGLPFTHRT